MQTSKFLVAALLLSTQITCIAETISCDEVKRFKPRGFRESHAVLHLSAGLIQKFSYDGAMASGEEGGGYTCALEVMRMDKKVKWLTNGARTSIWLAENTDSDSPNIVIKSTERSFIVEMNIDPQHYCGFGAEFPSKMAKTTKGACIATY